MNLANAISQHARESWNAMHNAARWRTGKTAPQDREIFGRYSEGVFAIRWCEWADSFQSTQTGDYFRNPDQWRDIPKQC